MMNTPGDMLMRCSPGSPGTGADATAAAAGADSGAGGGPTGSESASGGTVGEARSRLRAIVVRTAGTNCDGELAHAFRLAEAVPEFVHLRTLMDEPALLDQFHLIGVPGGFSYGDDIAAGRVFATYLRERLYAAFRRAVVERRAPVMAPCNGFQVLVKAGFLPGCEIEVKMAAGRDDPASAGRAGGEASTGTDWPDGDPPRQACTLTGNIGGSFIDRWVPVEIDSSSPCVWTRDLGDEPEGVAMVLPVAHGEGRFVAEPAVLDCLEQRDLVPVRYAASANVNGSDRAIAGLCDPTGLVFGLMPHPERYTSWLHHPLRTRLNRSVIDQHEPLGLRMFRCAVEYARQHTEVANTAVAVAKTGRVSGA